MTNSPDFLYFYKVFQLSIVLSLLSLIGTSCFCENFSYWSLLQLKSPHINTVYSKRLDFIAKDKFLYVNAVLQKIDKIVCFPSVFTFSFLIIGSFI